MPKGRESPHLRVRIEPRLLARLEKAREKSGRTLTGEIVSRLEQSFQREDRTELAVQAATTALERFSVVRVGAPTRDESQAEPAKPADANQKDKAP